MLVTLPTIVPIPSRCICLCPCFHAGLQQQRLDAVHVEQPVDAARFGAGFAEQEQVQQPEGRLGRHVGLPAAPAAWLQLRWGPHLTAVDPDEATGRFPASIGHPAEPLRGDAIDCGGRSGGSPRECVGLPESEEEQLDAVFAPAADHDPVAPLAQLQRHLAELVPPRPHHPAGAEGHQGARGGLLHLRHPVGTVFCAEPAA